MEVLRQEVAVEALKNPILKIFRPWAAGRPVEQLSGVCDRQVGGAGNLDYAANISSSDGIRICCLDIANLAVFK